MEIQKNIEKVLLVVVQFPQDDVDFVISEMEQLVLTAGGVVKLTVIQKRDSVDVATMIGSGKLQEIKTLVEANEIDVVIFNKNLSAVQRRNLEEVANCSVLDKTDLILDIFALHATSAEGKKQVELAQLSHSLACKSSKDFSRQGGGIGTRGPGETQLETDKRHIREKIHKLRLELNRIQKQRDTSRSLRKENEIFTVALVGYTNAGKSTLFNLLTRDCVLAEDKLFATLDTTTRKVKLENGIEVLFTDTVGFIKDLPHNLIEAFKSTLSELLIADLILNVCDLSDPNVDAQLEVTQKTLDSLGVQSKQIVVYNKIDKVSQSSAHIDTSSNCVFISATSGKNTLALLQMIERIVMEKYSRCQLLTPIECYSNLLQLLNKFCVDFSVEFDDENARVNALLQRKYLHIFTDFIQI